MAGLILNLALLPVTSSPVWKSQPRLNGARVTEMRQRVKARMAGFVYLLAVLAAIVSEFFIGGRVGVAVALTAVPCYVAVTGCGHSQME